MKKAFEAFKENVEERLAYLEKLTRKMNLKLVYCESDEEDGSSVVDNPYIRSKNAKFEQQMKVIADRAEVLMNT